MADLRECEICEKYIKEKHKHLKGWAIISTLWNVALIIGYFFV